MARSKSIIFDESKNIVNVKMKTSENYMRNQTIILCGCFRDGQGNGFRTGHRKGYRHMDMEWMTDSTS